MTKRRNWLKRRWPPLAVAIGVLTLAAFTTLVLTGVNGTAASSLATASNGRLQVETAVASTPSPSTTATPTPSASLRLVPSAAAIDRAIAYLRRRDCEGAVAVVDTHGALRGYHANRRFTSASVVKAMLLVQYLSTHHTVSPAMRSTLTAMITQSDNDDANLVYAEVGASGLAALADRAGMTRFTVGASVLASRITAADQARFFYAMDEYVPARHRALARALLSHVTAWQTWGVAEVARPAWQVFFKSGWLGAESDPYTLVNQVARLEKGKLRWSVAILTDGNPPSPYAFQTLRGITRRLLSP